MPATVTLLGPQRTTTTVGDVARQLAPTGRIATVTAGWQEREDEDDELDAALGGRSVNLALYARAERVWDEAPALRQAHRSLQSDLRLLRRSYDARLNRLMDAWRVLDEMSGSPAVLDPERHAALDDVRGLDRRHLERVEELRSAYGAATRPAEHEAVRRERAEIAAVLDDVSAVAIAGGHVAVLLNRLRLFELGARLSHLPIIAWSAGAMALADRVIVFHDSPPQGPGHAEAFDRGLGLAGGVVPLPHASRRLRLDDPRRVGRMARRFRPSSCVTLDGGEGVTTIDGQWVPLRHGLVGSAGARVLGPDGRVRELVA